jgi:formate hydrogenlyase subunit 4
MAIFLNVLVIPSHHAKSIPHLSSIKTTHALGLVLTLSAIFGRALRGRLNVEHMVCMYLRFSL